MKIKILAGTGLVLALGWLQFAALAQRGGGNNPPACINPPLKWVFADGLGDRILSDGGAYDGTSFFCGGKPDAHLSLSKGKRKVNLDFAGLVTTNPDGTLSADHRVAWMPPTGSVPLFGGFNVRALGRIREPRVPTRTMMAGTFTGPDSKSYLLRMTPLNDSLYVDEVLNNPPDSPPDVNTPWMTSSVKAIHYPAGDCPTYPSCNNPYGMWEVIGDHQMDQDGTVVPPVQTTTIYKSQGSLTRVGQFSMPFKVTITALAPLPPIVEP